MVARIFAVWQRLGNLFSPLSDRVLGRVSSAPAPGMVAGCRGNVLRDGAASVMAVSPALSCCVRCIGSAAGGNGLQVWLRLHLDVPFLSGDAGVLSAGTLLPRG